MLGGRGGEGGGGGGGGGGWPGWEQGRRKPLVFTEIKGFQVASWAVISHTLPGFVHGEARENDKLTFALRS